MKYSFLNDYSEIAHPNILSAISKYSNEQNLGYVEDTHSQNAKLKIKSVFEIPNSEVFFVGAGTQANMLVISFLLKNFEGVITIDTGHINVHETAAIEGSGHKVYTMPNTNGKITPDDILKSLKLNTSEHMVSLKMVYISNSTEYGTIYKKKELENIYKICKENDLLLFVDGARLASALSSEENDMSPKEFASLCDIFTVGGTKNGLLFGEAIVFNDKNLTKNFRYHVKNKGALFAKGFVLGIQFEELFKNNLYFDIGKHENELAGMVTKALKEMGIKFFMESPTNQIFPVFKKDIVKKIKELYLISDWDDLGDEICVRFAFSWFTKVEVVKELIEDLKKILK